MIRILRAGLALLAAAALAATAAAAPKVPAKGKPATAAAAQPFKLAPGQWPQAKSDLKADPDIRFGALPNGMRYAIRKQTIPPGQGAIRMWIDAGSLMEADDQQGLAHFLEHMAFNGSKGVKEGEMIRILERLGLAFGPDTNASTGFDQTVYMLDLPKTDPATLDTSLMLMREAAGNLTIAPAAVDRERGVVLSEERSSDTPGMRVQRAQLSFLLPGQKLPERIPIGTVEVLKTAPASRVADFYRRYYRPERAVLVAVGDFDVDAVEAKIRAKFGDWKPVGPAGPAPDLGRIKPRGTEAKVVVEPGAPLIVRLTWVRPPDMSPDTYARRRRDLVEQLGFSVLNRRFSAIGRGADPPFIGAGANEEDEANSAELVSVAVRPHPGRWQQALAAAEREQRRAVQFGVRQDELDREIEEIRAMVKAGAAGAATRRPQELANEIVGTLNDRQVVTSPAEDLRLFEEMVKGLTAAEVSAALKAKFQGEGPLVFVATPEPIAGAETAVLAELTASQKVAVTPPTATAQVAWPYESFGAPGRVAERREVADLKTTFVRFENGVRLTVKPTDFRKEEVLVRVNIGDGLLALPKDRQTAQWAYGAVMEGGLKKISNEDMERVLASKVIGARFGITDDAIVLSGATRTGDLPTQLQVLAAYASEPGWRPEAFQRIMALGSTIHDQLEATDNGVFSREANVLLHAGDRRFAFPSRQQIAAAKLEDVQAEVAPQLLGGPIEVVIVGDVTVDQAISETAKTFGALPRRPEPRPLPPEARAMGFPGPVREPVTFTHKGRADQAIAYIAWRTSDVWADPQRARAISLLGEVLQNRLTEELRETQGATYSPSASVNNGIVWTGWGYISAQVEVPPAKVPEFFADVQKIAADLRAREITPDELARAKKPRIEGLQRTRVTNQFWLAQLSGAQADPRRLQLVRDSIPGAEKVTAADVRRVAETFLKDEAFKMVVKPQGN